MRNKYYIVIGNGQGMVLKVRDQNQAAAVFKKELKISGERPEDQPYVLRYNARCQKDGNWFPLRRSQW